MFVHRRDLFLPRGGLWIDPAQRRSLAFVSHAHGDHIGRHGRVLATPATGRILRHRLGAVPVTELPFGEPYALPGGGTLSALPAGHILGSAQLLVEDRGSRLVYTGDFKLRDNETAEDCEVVPCDELILETTYGRPHYRFPPRSEVVPQLVDRIETVLQSGGTPTLLAYTLGRSQELLKILQPFDFSIRLAPPIFSMTKVYEELGVQFGAFERALPGQTEGCVLFVPPHAGRSKLVKTAVDPVLIAATGWAMDGQKGPPYPTDFSYPVSDHADFDELLEYVERAQPKVVYTTHGFDEFREHLHHRGIRAHPVESRVSML